MEIAAFLVACAGFMSTEETLSMTKAMIDVGEQLNWDAELVVDKHCIGGIPGNRTSMIIVPIVAAHGLVIPKTSSRAITSPAGTADTMEVLAHVDLTDQQMADIVAREHAFLARAGLYAVMPRAFLPATAALGRGVPGRTFHGPSWLIHT
jgi:thymidine phosphorylase